MSARRLKAVFLLRWQLSRNAFCRASAFSATVYVILRILFLFVLIGGTIGAFFLGKSDILVADPNRILWVLSGAVSVFLFFWLIGLLAELQRSDSLEQERAWRQRNLRRHQERLREAIERLRKTLRTRQTSLQKNAPGD